MSLMLLNLVQLSSKKNFLMGLRFDVISLKVFQIFNLWTISMGDTFLSSNSPANRGKSQKLEYWYKRGIDLDVP